MKNKKIISLLLVLFFSFVLNVYNKSSANDILIDAETVDIKEKGNLILASGDVNITEGTNIKIKGNNAKYNKLEKKVEIEGNVIYFKSPTEIKVLSEVTKKKIRVGGMVKKNSININQSEVNFVITDFKNELIVNYKGSIPNLFEEEKGVVAEGFLQDRNYFKAVKILAKHDENYMPPEVAESLKEN